MLTVEYNCTINDYCAMNSKENGLVGANTTTSVVMDGVPSESSDTVLQVRHEVCIFSSAN